MFKDWSEYYFMLGSSAAALIGLMFVVATLTTGRDTKQAEQGKHLYTSPIVWHLGGIVVVSGAAIAPSMTPALFGIGAAGLSLVGLAICIRNAIGIGRHRIAGADNTTFDVWWYGIVPASIYAALGAAASGVIAETRWGENAVAAAVMALLLVSIHAEWDLVTFLAPMAALPSSDKAKPND
jgi:hypothetical protein